ncbi:MAG: methyl-accepting chemotaxis protein [Nitrospiraceae bacterium]|nr:methyl-accepting chemotaxis protein [Nitrospiraceae bacterium]
MKIKTKLTWNVITVIVIVGAVAATSVVGMGFVKSKLFYLTERSTPFQMRTVEFQRAIQGTTADLIKVSASKNTEEYKAYRTEAERSLAEVKSTQDALESLSGGEKAETYSELNRISKEFFEITEGRLKAENDAVAANKTITQKLKEASDKLNALDTKIESLKLNRVAAFETLLSEAKDIDTVRKSRLMTDADIATTTLIRGSQFIAMAQSVEISATRLFTLDSIKEVSNVEAAVKKMFEKIDLRIKSLEKSLKRLEAKEEITVLSQVDGSLQTIKGSLLARDGIIAKVRQQLNMREKALQATERLREIVLKQAERGKKTVATARGEQEKALGTVNKMVRFSSLLVIAISAGATVFGIVFGTWIYRSIARPLNELIVGADRIAQGDLACARSEDSKDEIGMVNKSMCKMIENLSGIVGKIKTSTGTLATSSEELSTTATTLEKGSNEQTSRIEQSATAITEMSQTTLDVAKNASHTADVAQKMKNIALQGKDAMRATMDELQKFADTVRESALRVESLGQKSEEINGIITLIKGIADQTNLLALNAAIEAARAGEQGRGFAVVADNVRQLAERTAVATGDIGNTVSVMQTEVSDSVNFMQKEKESVGKVLDQVNNTLRSIDEIVSHVEQVADMVQRIAVATEEQSSASEEVSQNMDNIAVTTRELSNSIIEIKSASENLSKLAAELNSMAGWFKVA